MKYFVTGASGFIGSALVKELISHKHQVVGLARSDASAKAIEAMGAEVIRGDLHDEAALAKGASESDGVAHCGFIHDFSNFEAACKTDFNAIEVMVNALQGTNKPFVASFGTLGLPNDHIATEEDKQPEEGFGALRVKSERILLSLAAEKGISTMALRLAPTVHGEGDKAFIAGLVGSAQKAGKAAYVGDGTSRWCAVHRLDAAVLYRLALENPKAGTVLHAIQDEGVQMKDIASKIGQKLNLPVESISAGDEAMAHFGFLGGIVTIDTPVSSAATRKTFGWEPKQSTLLQDLDKDFYYEPGTKTKFAS
jgi:nucleoside-diphosphate-sugar epimerase